MPNVQSVYRMFTRVMPCTLGVMLFWMPNYVRHDNMVHKSAQDLRHIGVELARIHKVPLHTYRTHTHVCTHIHMETYITREPHTHSVYMHMSYIGLQMSCVRCHTHVVYRMTHGTWHSYNARTSHTLGVHAHVIHSAATCLGTWRARCHTCCIRAHVCTQECCGTCKCMSYCGIRMNVITREPRKSSM